jgi:hypothetical protein
MESWVITRIASRWQGCGVYSSSIEITLWLLLLRYGLVVLCIMTRVHVRLCPMKLKSWAIGWENNEANLRLHEAVVQNPIYKAYFQLPLDFLHS